jgi:WD40 repeat protein
MITFQLMTFMTFSVTWLLSSTTNAVVQSPEILKKLHELKHDGHLSGVSYAMEEGEIVTSGGDGTIRFWDATSGAAKEILTINFAVRPSGKSGDLATVPQPYPAIAWGKHKWLVRMPSELGLGIWDREKRKFGPFFTFPNRPILAHYVKGPEAVVLLMTDERGVPIVWDVKGRKVVRKLNPKSPVTLGQFSPDGKRILTYSPGDQSLRLWDVATGKQVQRLGKTEIVTSFAFSTDGKRVITGGNTLYLWDAETGKEIRHIELPEEAEVATGGRGVAFSPDGKRILALTHKGKTDCTLRLFDLEAGNFVARADRKVESLAREADFCVLFSPDGRRAITYGGPITTPEPQAKIATVWEMPATEGKD